MRKTVLKLNILPKNYQGRTFIINHLVDCEETVRKPAIRRGWIDFSARSIWFSLRRVASKSFILI